MEDAAVLYIYNPNFVVLHFQVEAAATSFHNVLQAAIHHR